MPRVYNCFLLVLVLVLLAPSAQAQDWRWYHYLNPWYLLGYTELNSEEDDEQYYDAQEYLETEENFQSFVETPEMLFDSLDLELQEHFIQAGITRELLANVLGSNGNARAKLSQLLRELVNAQPERKLEHHKFLRHLIRIVCFVGGSINRVAAYPGLKLLLLYAGAPDFVAEGVALIVTAVSMFSSNILSVEGANKLRLEGLHNFRELCSSLIAGAATAVDCGMAYRALYNLVYKATEDVTKAVVAGVTSVPFMFCGLYPILVNKLIDLSYSLYGENPEKEILLRDTVQLIADAMHEMKSQGCTMDSSLRDRMEAELKVMGRGQWGAKTLALKLLDASCIHGCYAKRLNTAKGLLKSGVLKVNDDPRSVPEQLYRQTKESRQSAPKTAAKAALLVMSIGPSLAYVFGDSTSLTKLLQKELSLHLSCGKPLETFNYWMYQGGATVLMAGKGLAAAKNGADNLQRFVTWVKSSCQCKGRQCQCACTGEHCSKKDMGLNLVAFTAAIFYALNNAGTVVNNLYHLNGTDAAGHPVLEGDTCLGAGTAAAIILPAASALGGFGFNAGCGPQLAKVWDTAKAAWHAVAHPNIKEVFSSCSRKTDPYMEGLQSLIEAGVLVTPDYKQRQHVVDWITQEGFEVTDELVNQVTLWLELKALKDFLTANSQELDDEEDEIIGWLTANGFTDNPELVAAVKVWVTQQTARQVKSRRDERGVSEGTPLLNEPVQPRYNNWAESYLSTHQLNMRLMQLISVEDEDVIRGRPSLLQYLRQLSFLLDSNTELRIQPAYGGQLSLYMAMLRAFRGIDNPETAMKLRAKLWGFLLHLLDKDSAKSGKQKRFIRKIGHDNLARLVFDLAQGDTHHPMLLQVMALMENTSIAFITHTKGKLTIYYVDRDEPEVLSNPDNFLLATVFLVHNGVGHWSWMDSENIQHHFQQVANQAGFNQFFQEAPPPDPGFVYHPPPQNHGLVEVVVQHHPMNDEPPVPVAPSPPQQDADEDDEGIVADNGGAGDDDVPGVIDPPDHRGNTIQREESSAAVSPAFKVALDVVPPVVKVLVNTATIYTMVHMMK